MKIKKPFRDSLKVGLAGWYDSDNFGTVLQTYALYHILKKLGYEPIIVNPPKFMRFYYLLRSPLYLLRQVFKKMCCPGRAVQAVNAEKRHKIQQFIHDNYTILSRNYSRRAFLDETDRWQGLIIGSDQVWNPYHLFLFGTFPFPSRTRKIAYASSIGVHEIPEKYHRWYRPIKDFQAISCREKQGCDVLSQLLGKEIRWVLDPTLLLTREEWSHFAARSSMSIPPDRPYLCCYFVNNNDAYWEKVAEVKKQLNISHVCVITLNNTTIDNDCEKINDAGPYDFVQLLRQAAFVVTDSFHVLSFCLNMQKDFIALKRFADHDPKGQNSRVWEFCSRFGLQERLCDRQLPEPLTPIDFAGAEQTLLELRNDSLTYLVESLKS